MLLVPSPRRTHILAKKWSYGPFTVAMRVFIAPYGVISLHKRAPECLFDSQAVRFDLTQGLFTNCLFCESGKDSTLLSVTSGQCGFVFLWLEKNMVKFWFVFSIGGGAARRGARPGARPDEKKTQAEDGGFRRGKRFWFSP